MGGVVITRQWGDTRVYVVDVADTVPDYPPRQSWTMTRNREVATVFDTAAEALELLSRPNSWYLPEVEPLDREVP